MTDTGYLMNTTFVVHVSLTERFIRWAREVYLKAAADSGIFGEPLMMRVHQEVDPQADSIAVQLPAANLDDATRWHDETAAMLKDVLRARWGEGVLFFTTYMTVIPTDIPADR